MAFTVEEQWDARKITEGATPSRERTYIAFAGDPEGDDEEAAWAAILAASPAMIEGLARQEFGQFERIAWDTYKATMRWGKFAVRVPMAVGESSYSFTTAGGTQHITQSLATVESQPAGATDHKGAIGVTDDGVEGVDITSPIFNFTETHIFALATVDQAYKLAVAALTGRVNAATFRGFAAGEVLFLGASGQLRGQEDWEITFNFAALPNVTSVPVGDLTVDAKMGWEYLWIRYREEVDAEATPPTTRRVPAAAYVEQVYRTGDFSVLGI